MKCGTIEVTGAFNLRQLRSVQLAQRRDHRVRLKLFSMFRADAPPVAFAVPAGGLGAVAASESRRQREVVHQLTDVTLHFGGARKHVSPVEARRERELIQAHRDIARAARIGVVAPGSSGIAGAVKDNEIVDSRARKMDSRADSPSPPPTMTTFFCSGIAGQYTPADTRIKSRRDRFTCSESLRCGMNESRMGCAQIQCAPYCRASLPAFKEARQYGARNNGISATGHQVP